MYMMMRDSKDPVVRAAQPKVDSGRKWKVLEDVEEAEGRLRVKEVVGAVHQGRRGLSWKKLSWWPRVNERGRRVMVSGGPEEHVEGEKGYSSRMSATTRCIHGLGECRWHGRQVVRFEEYATISYQLLAVISLRPFAHERKATKYHDMKNQIEDNGWKCHVYPVKVGCRSFVGQSTVKFLNAIGVESRVRQATIRKLHETAETASMDLDQPGLNGNRPNMTRLPCTPSPTSRNL